MNGRDEPFARLDYLDSLSYPDLWEGRCHVVAGAGHAPFFQQAESFNALLARFLDDVDRSAVRHAGAQKAVRSA